MKDTLAEELLARIMKWTPEDVARERPDLQALAAYKYDEYQQFSPGMRFIESLALWLEQFQTDNERHTAYDFMKKRLIYLSSLEITNLVLTSYPDVIKPLLVKQIALQKAVPEWQVAKIIESLEFNVLLRQSMFLGLSDGSRIDIFRRGSRTIDHEQILRTHEITDRRATDMIRTLTRDLKRILCREPSIDEKHFKNVFLLDDFSASGISYIRKGNDPPYEGKIATFYYDYCGNNRKTDLINPKDLRVHLILYVATNQAIDRLTQIGREMFGTIPFDVKAVYLLKDHAQIDETEDSEFIELSKKYYDSSIETPSYLRGRHEKPYLGFNECALPLVLNHNTPNNSVTLLWFEENRKYRGLFPRISRFTI